MTLAATVVADGKTFANDWSTWLYPATIRPQLSVPVFADEAQSQTLNDWRLAPIPAAGDLDNHAVYVVTWPCDPRVTDAMKRGASVVVLGGGEHLLKSYPITFRTTWWQAGDKPESNLSGTFVYDHPVTRSMGPDGWCDGGWFDLLEGAAKFDLETASVRPEVIVRALPSLLLVKDKALPFEVSVEKGSLIISGLNHVRR